MKLKKYYTEEEINNLPEKISINKKNLIVLISFLIVILTGLIMLALGITFLSISGGEGFIILTIFGGMITFFSFIILVFKENTSSLETKLKKTLINQAINETFNGEVIYDPVSKMDSQILRLMDICPFDVAQSGEKLIIKIDKRSVVISEVSSTSNLSEISALLLASPELGVIGTAFIGLLGTISKLNDKSMFSNKFKGALLLIPNVRKNNDCIVEVRSKKFLTPLSSLFKNQNKFETEDIQANEKYNFYATDIIEGFKFITPLMIDTINSIDKVLKKGFIMVFKEDYLVLAFSEENININDIVKNNKIPAKSGYYMVKSKLLMYKNILKLILKNKNF